MKLVLEVLEDNVFLELRVSRHILTLPEVSVEHSLENGDALSLILVVKQETELHHQFIRDIGDVPELMLVIPLPEGAVLLDGYLKEPIRQLNHSLQDIRVFRVLPIDWTLATPFALPPILQECL